MRCVLMEVDPSDFLIFIGLIEGLTVVKQRCLDTRSRGPMLKHAVEIDAEHNAPQVQQ